MSRAMKIVLFAVGFLAATGLQAARAAEAFLCADGRIVHVPFGKLAEMKRTDACVAAYFGLTIAPAPGSSASARAEPTTPTTSAPTPAGPAAPVPTARPASAAAVSTAAPAVAMRRLDPQEPPSTRPTKPRVVADAGLPVRAADGTDYRNVVIINAADGAPGLYRHER